MTEKIKSDESQPLETSNVEPPQKLENPIVNKEVETSKPVEEPKTTVTSIVENSETDLEASNRKKRAKETKPRIRRTRAQIEADNLKNKDNPTYVSNQESEAEEIDEKVDNTSTSDFILETNVPEQPKPKETYVQPSNTSNSSTSVMIDEKAMALLLNTVFDSVAASRGNHWKLSKDDHKALDPPACRVANKYLPSILGKYADEFALIIAVIGIMTPRIFQDMDDIKRAKQQKEVVLTATNNPQVRVMEEPKPIVVNNRTIEQMYPSLNK